MLTVVHWKIDNIPPEVRPDVLVWFESNNYNEIKTVIVKYNVIGGTGCSSCNMNRQIMEWFTYLFDNYPKWKDGINANW